MELETSMSVEERKIMLCSGLALASLGYLATYSDAPGWVKSLLHAPFVSCYLVAAFFELRTWAFEMLGLTGKSMDPKPDTLDELCRILGYKPDGRLDDNASDWEDIEDTRNSSGTFEIDTPSETGNSDSSSISISTDSLSTNSISTGSISVDRTDYSKASASDATDPDSDSDDTISSLGSAIQPFPQQKIPRCYKSPRARLEAAIRRRQTAKATNTTATTIQHPEPPKSKDQNPIESIFMTLKQPPKEELSEHSRIPKNKMPRGYQSGPTNYLYEKAKQQPADVIVLYIVKGIEDEERMLVRMHKTAPFILLKNELRDKDDAVSELAIKDPEGEFPVFDYDTPLSIGLNPLNILFWRPMPNMPTALDSTGKDRCKGTLVPGRYECHVGAC